MSNKPMHIGIVLPSVPGYSEIFFRNKIEGLQKNGFRVTLFVKNRKRGETFICPVKVHPKLLKNGFLRFIQTTVIFLRLLLIAPSATQRILAITKFNGYALSQRIRAAVIGATILPEKLDWLHFGFATAALERELISKAIGAKLAVSLRGYDIAIVPAKNKGCYNLLWQNVDKVHSISNDLLELAYKDGLRKDVKAKIITPAIQVSDFFSLKGTERRSEIINLLTVGRLHWKKGLEYTLGALVKLKSHGINFKYTIVGEGDEFERLVFACHQLELENVLEFRGKIPHDEIPFMMHNSDIYIQYSIQEGFCNAVLEAQAAEMLCVVSDAEGLQENILDGKTGWVVPKRNPKALAEKLIEVIALSAEKKAEIRKQARERVEKEFNLEKQQREFVAFYSEN